MSTEYQKPTGANTPQLGVRPSIVPSRRKFHGATLRGFDFVRSSFSTRGRFGRMFRNVPVYEHQDTNLSALAKSMISPADPKDALPVPDPEPFDDEENSDIPAGYTYLGQFIDHDITFDPASSLQRQNDPDALSDFRTPRFDLDSLYGAGPADQPYLYRGGPKADPHPSLGFDQRGVMFLLGTPRSDPQKEPEVMGPDLPRNSEGRAIIGDPRNDENLIVSQLHGLFLKFHNVMAERVFKETGLTGDDLFKATQREVRWHYQWIVIHDFLKKIVDGDSAANVPRGILGDIMRRETYSVGDGQTIAITRPKLLFYHWHEEPYIPIEFSVAAYRFGHSMVRPAYFINDFVRQQSNRTRIPIFAASHDPLASLMGFRPLPERWGFQWKYFFDVDSTVRPQKSYKIDTKLSTPLKDLPGFLDIANLAHRNLLRGLRMSLPSGQNVARAMGIAPLSDGDLDLTGRGAPDFEGDSPLWFYVLREAEILAGGRHLGPVGGRIVAEVFVGLLLGDPSSWLESEPNWQPALSVGGRFGMPELIKFVEGRSEVNTTPPSAQAGTLNRWRASFGNQG